MASTHISLEENHPIMSFVIDSDDKYIATNLRKQGVHLWDYKAKTLLRVFVGVVQRNFLIRSSFSYSERKYLASGSEGELSIQIICLC